MFRLQMGAVLAVALGSVFAIPAHASRTAIARSDHDFAFTDDTTSPRVSMPEFVRLQIERELQRLWIEQAEWSRVNRTDLATRESMDGPTYFVPAPRGLSLYIFIPQLHPAFVHAIAILCDPVVRRCTPKSTAHVSWPSWGPDDEYAKHPYVQFDDLDRNGSPELVLQEFTHNGTWSARNYIYFAIGKDLSLTPMLRYEAAFPYYASESDDYDHVREIKKLGPGVIQISTHPTHPKKKNAAPLWTLTLRSPRPGAPFSFETKKDYKRCHDESKNDVLAIMSEDGATVDDYVLGPPPSK